MSARPPHVLAIADKYISPEGGKPMPPSTEGVPKRVRPVKRKTITLPIADYKRLLAAAELDDDIGWCERCKAWLDKNDEAWVDNGDYQGCVSAGTQDRRFNHLCRRWRAIEGEKGS